jgi:hypothetical protein
MVTVALTPDENALRRIHRIQIVTILWMRVEAGTSLAAAWTAHSPALLQLVTSYFIDNAFCRSVMKTPTELNVDLSGQIPVIAAKG